MRFTRSSDLEGGKREGFLEVGDRLGGEGKSLLRIGIQIATGLGRIVDP
jgi:hypothetical protein